MPKIIPPRIIFSPGQWFPCGLTVGTGDQLIQVTRFKPIGIPEVRRTVKYICIEVRAASSKAQRVLTSESSQQRRVIPRTVKVQSVAFVFPSGVLKLIPIAGSSYGSAAKGIISICGLDVAAGIHECNRAA